MEKKQSHDELIVSYLADARQLAYIYVKNTHDAEDIVSESFEKAMRKIHTLRDPKAVKAWFFKIVINTSLDHLKKKKRIMALNAVPDDNLYYFQDLSKLEFEDLLVMLPKDDVRILSLRFYDNCELEEIAKRMKMNENTVKTRLYRALKKLKLEIDENGNSLRAKKQNKSIAKNIMLGIVAALISVTCVFNLSPALAVAAYDIPVIGDIVRIITFNRFEYKDGNYDAEILVPEIHGLLDPVLQDKLNAEFSENADDLIRSFEAAILALEELGEEPVLMSIKADYEVKTDNDKTLSLNTYIYSDTGNFVVHKFYTIDKRSGSLVELSDLFKLEADFIKPISTYLIDEMLRINKEEDGTFSVGESMFDLFVEIKPEQNFYINNDGRLVICFDKYEVAAGVQGSPEFIIPPEVIKDIADSDLLQ